MNVKKNIISLDNNQIYFIIKRFHSKFKLRRNSEYENPNMLPDKIEDINYIWSYKYLCVYSDTINRKKENLVLKYTYKNMDEIICLNLPLYEYEDLL
jgi:hypothetical protein